MGHTVSRYSVADKLGSLSWRNWLLISYILIVLVFAVLWTYFLLGPVANTMHEQQVSNLKALVHTTGAAIKNTGIDRADEVTESVSNDIVRLTLIDESGRVISDSEANVPEMENHSDRPEFVSALAGEVGMDQRRSETTGQSQLYVAESVQIEQRTYVIRISEPTLSIADTIGPARTTGIILLAIGVVISVVIAWGSLSSASKPAGDLQRIRSDFVTNASHELKTPVAGIRLLAESIAVAAEDDESDIVQVFSKRLDEEAERLQNLVTELLDLNRLESTVQGGEIVDPTIDIHSVMITSVESHRLMAREKGLRLDFIDHTPADMPCRVRMGPADASLIVDNLIENAIRYTEEGGVTVSLDVDNKRAKITVADTGIGIPDQDIPRIFERFYRVDVARSRESGGTGLGLSLVRHAILRSNGTIEVSSSIGEGSTFIVRIPLER